MHPLVNFSQDILPNGGFGNLIALPLQKKPRDAKRGKSLLVFFSLIRLAAFQNHEFYQAQAMRQSTFGKPPIISCCEDFPKHLGQPRGCLRELLDLFNSLNVKMTLTDQRIAGTPLGLVFDGTLHPEKQQTADTYLQRERGVLAACLIAHRKVNTLMIVHRRQLLDQWIEELSQFLELEPKQEIPCG